MKYFCMAAIMLLFATAASAQVQIGSPPVDSQVKAGHKFKVEVVEPNSIEGPIEVALVISFLPCTSVNDAACPPANEELGLILYNGPYKPQYPSPNPYHLQPHQNFTVTIPSGTSTGKGVLFATHFALYGAGPSPTYQVVNITLDVA